MLLFMIFFLFISKKDAIADSNMLDSENICRKDNYLKGVWVEKPKDKVKKSFYCCLKTDNDAEKEKLCGLKDTDNFDIGYGASKDLFMAPDHGCICDILDGRFVNHKWEQYVWKPHDCILSEWNAADFCVALGTRRILMVGDSLMHQAASTLHAMLKVAKASCIEQISFGKTTHVTYSKPMKFSANKNLDAYFTNNNGADICILNTGAHQKDLGDVYKIWESFKPKMDSYKSIYNTTFAWMTQSYGHLGCMDFDKPDEVFHPIDPSRYEEDNYLYHLFPQFDELSRNMSRSWGLPVIDISMLALRPDGHKGDRMASIGKEEWYTKVDCLHWCMPGPMNIFPEILLNKLINNEI
jgi:hypothetical protein